MPTSTPQVIPTITVFDYVYDQAGKAMASAKVLLTLQYNQGVNTSPQASIAPLRYTVETDPNGFWQIGLVPNPSITPNGTTYMVETPYNSYEISVPASAGPYQATSILVNQPTVLTPGTSSTGALTVTGLLTASAGLTVAGAVTLPSSSIPESTVTNLTSDLTARALDAAVVHLAGTETITGSKTFTAGTTAFSGAVTTLDVAATGAGTPFTTQGRFLGRMSTAGPPGSGTWVAGDFGFDVNFVQWVCTAGGTPGTWTTVNGTFPFATNTLSASTGTSFSPPSYGKHCQIKIFAVGPAAGTATDVQLQVNSDTGTNYWWGQLFISGTTPAGAANGAGTTFSAIAQLPASSSNHGYALIDIPYYSGTTNHKGFFGNSFHVEGFSSANNVGAMRWGWHIGTGAITSIALNFTQALTGTAQMYVST